MRDSNTRAGNKEPKVQCLEVLVSRASLERSGNNLQWTLSVYSLENQPVRKKFSENDSEIFHFMVYDWKRTIKQLLENLKIPFSITQYFTPASIYREAKQTLYFSENDPEAGCEVEASALTDPSYGESTDFVFDETNASTLPH
jgi:hypothetical protein